MDSRDPAPPVNSTTVRRKDPLRHRRYLHFDERPPRDHLVSRVGDPARVAQWQFLPLLRKMERSKRVRDKDPLTGLFSVKEKIRPICYASHQDAALYNLCRCLYDIQLVRREPSNASIVPNVRKSKYRKIVKITDVVKTTLGRLNSPRLY